MKKILKIFIIYFFFTLNVFSDEFNISAIEVNYLKDDNKIIAIGEVVANDNAGIIIYSDKATYLQNEKIIIAEGSVQAVNENNTKIFADKIIFNKKNNIITAYQNVEIIEGNEIDKLASENVEYNLNTNIFKSFDKTFVYLKNKYSIVTSNAIYNKNKGIILSRFKTDIYDTLKNHAELQNFKYLLSSKTIRSQGLAKLLDSQNNTYIVDDMLIDTNKKKSFGSNLKVKFDKNIFKNDEQDPRLYGNTIEMTDNISTIKKGVYTTCALNNNKCPPWKIKAKSIIHNKEKKRLSYKNAWLNFYDIPVLYFPLYFHPDPTVERQSGFLRPHFTSSNAGSALNTPYYVAFDEHRDLTFFPRVYIDKQDPLTAEENPVLQFEYRHFTKNAKTVAEFSYNQGYKTTGVKKTPGSRNHLFIDTEIDFKLPDYEYSDLKINIRKTSNDTYLRVHNLFSELTKEYNTMHSFANFEFKKKDSTLNVRMDSYENLTAYDNRYEYIFPNFDYFTNLKYGKYKEDEESKSNLDYQLRSYYKNYNADADEFILVNDLYYSSDEKIWNNGFQSSFIGQIKNTNYDSQHSSIFKDETSNEITGSVALLSSLPLRRKSSKIKETLVPRFMIRHGPGHMRNLSGGGLSLNYSNLFSLNKISNIDTIENGTSIILGTEYDVDFRKNTHSFSLDFGQVFNLEKNNNMPTQSSLQNKSSELVGSIGYNFDTKKENRITYDFSMDSNYDTINYHGITGDFKINNFAGNFDYIEERNFIGTSSYGQMDLKLDLNDKNSLQFSTRKNFRTDDTEFYNLIYQYETDCLIAGIQFKKDFYNYQDVKADQKLLFTITLIPIGEIPLGSKSQSKQR